MIYIVCFIASAALLNLHLKANNKITKCILFTLAIAFPVLLATVRSVDVGIDSSVYIRPYASMAENSTSFFTYFVLMIANSVEPGYILVNYIAAKLWNGVPGVFAITQLLTIVPVYLRFSDFREKAPVWVMSLIYLLMFYNMSLNLTRQAIAMAIIFYAYRHIEDKQYLKFVIWVCIAATFHYSAVMALFFLVIEYVVKGNANAKAVKTMLILGALALAIIFYNQIFEVVIKVIFSTSSEKYTNAFLSNETGYLSYWNILFKILTILAVWLNHNSFRRDGVYNRYFLITVFDLILYLLTIYNGNNFRFSLYFNLFTPVVVPQVRTKFTKGTRFAVDILVVVIYLFYWYNFNVLSYGHGTMPYDLNPDLF